MDLNTCAQREARIRNGSIGASTRGWEVENEVRPLSWDQSSTISLNKFFMNFQLQTWKFLGILQETFMVSHWSSDAYMMENQTSHKGMFGRKLYETN